MMVDDSVYIFLQARTGSTRLPKKMIKSFYQEKTIPEIIINSLKSFYRPDNIILTTSINKDDLALCEMADKSGVQFYRGSENDVLQRFIDCAESFKATTIVRICADNPFLRPEYIAPLVEKLQNENLNYTSFQWKDGTPVMLSHIGVFAEAMTIDFLRKIKQSTNDPLYLEHVTNYIYTHKNEFAYAFLPLPEFLDKRQKIRLTVDTESDFNVAQELYSKISEKGKTFELVDLLELIDENPVLKLRMETQIKENAK